MLRLALRADCAGRTSVWSVIAAAAGVATLQVSTAQAQATEHETEQMYCRAQIGYIMRGIDTYYSDVMVIPKVPSSDRIKEEGKYDLSREYARQFGERVQPEDPEGGLQNVVCVLVPMGGKINDYHRTAANYNSKSFRLDWRPSLQEAEVDRADKSVGPGGPAAPGDADGRRDSEAETAAAAREAREAEFEAKMAEYNRRMRERDTAIERAREQEEANSRQLAAARQEAADELARYEEERANYDAELKRIAELTRRQEQEYQDMLAGRSVAMPASEEDRARRCSLVREVRTGDISPSEGEAIASARRALPYDRKTTGSPTVAWVDFSISGNGSREYLKGSRGYEARIPFEREICSGNAATGRRE